MRILSKICSIISYAIKRLLFLLEVFLFLRLLLKFLNANPEAIISRLIYECSDIIVYPFKFIFPDIHWPPGYTIETIAIAAMVGYAILVFVLFRLFRLFSED